MLLAVVGIVQAQGPNSSGIYYKNADGKSGAELKTALYSIISQGTVKRTYAQLWNDFKTTDKRADGKVWDMYSNATNFTFGTNQDKGEHPNEGYSYNREHSFPLSWWGSMKDEVPQYTDLFHLYPTDAFVNEKRSSYPFGETNGNKFKSSGGFSKLGNCTTPGYTGIVFEPADEYKGDFARTYFYMITRYEPDLTSWGSNHTLDGKKYPGLKQWQLTMLMRWAEQDPVSEKEVKRNKAVYGIQKNRNPFIDYPGLERFIWGDKVGMPFNYTGLVMFIAGDANGDGKVDVSDYIGVANYILGSEPEDFDAEAADVNGDNVIDVSDYIGIANIILTGSAN